MPERERLRIKKEKEMRTKEISQMIQEGGLGSEQYYEIEKKRPVKSDKSDKTDKSDKDKQEDDS